MNKKHLILLALAANAHVHGVEQNIDSSRQADGNETTVNQTVTQAQEPVESESNLPPILQGGHIPNIQNIQNTGRVQMPNFTSIPNIQNNTVTQAQEPGESASGRQFTQNIQNSSMLPAHPFPNIQNTWPLHVIDWVIVPYLDSESLLKLSQASKRHRNQFVNAGRTWDGWRYMRLHRSPNDQNAHMILPGRDCIIRNDEVIQQVIQQIENTTAGNQVPRYARNIILMGLDGTGDIPQQRDFGERKVTIVSKPPSVIDHPLYWVAESIGIKGENDLTLESVGMREEIANPGPQDMATVKHVWMQSNNEDATVRYNSGGILVPDVGKRRANIPVAVIGGAPCLEMRQADKRTIDAKGNSVIMNFEKGYIPIMWGYHGNTLGSIDSNSVVGLSVNQGLNVNATTNKLTSVIPIDNLVFKAKDADQPSSIHLLHVPERMDVTVNVHNKGDKVFSFGRWQTEKRYSACGVDTDIHPENYSHPLTYTIREKVIGTDETTTFTYPRTREHETDQEERKE